MKTESGMPSAEPRGASRAALSIDLIIRLEEALDDPLITESGYDEDIRLALQLISLLSNATLQGLHQSEKLIEEHYDRDSSSYRGLMAGLAPVRALFGTSADARLGEPGASLRSAPAGRAHDLKAAPMTGFFAGLTDEQRSRALEYRGDDHLGEPTASVSEPGASPASQSSTENL